MAVHLLLSLWLHGDLPLEPKMFFSKDHAWISSVPPTQAKVVGRELVIVLWEVHFISQPFPPSTSHCQCLLGSEILPGNTISPADGGRLDLIFLKDLKAESEVQHPYPIKASR